MKLNDLSFNDKDLITKYLSLSRHELSVYSFENIFLWKALYEVFWAVSDDNLLLFFKDKIGCFLYLPPLGRKINGNSIVCAFETMDGFNKNRNISRIENVETGYTKPLESLGYEGASKPGDYIYKNSLLIALAGDKFKSKRAGINYFQNHYDFTVEDFSPEFSRDCLELYRDWMAQRKTVTNDKVFCGMLEDSLRCLEFLFNNLKFFDVKGVVIKVGRQIKAFTLGYQLNPDTFCVLYEIADLSVKGLSQYIFRSFCRNLKDYRFINAMDDSGLDNLKKVKMSYKPFKLIPNFVFTRPNA